MKYIKAITIFLTVMASNAFAQEMQCNIALTNVHPQYVDTLYGNIYITSRGDGTAYIKLVRGSYKEFYQNVTVTSLGNDRFSLSSSYQLNGIVEKGYLETVIKTNHGTYNVVTCYGSLE